MVKMKLNGVHHSVQFILGEFKRISREQCQYQFNFIFLRKNATKFIGFSLFSHSV